jgi:hypothetical protein
MMRSLPNINALNELSIACFIKKELSEKRKELSKIFI